MCCETHSSYLKVNTNQSDDVLRGILKSYDCLEFNAFNVTVLTKYVSENDIHVNPVNKIHLYPVIETHLSTVIE